MRVLYSVSTNRGQSLTCNKADLGSYIRYPTPSGREQMALICSDRDRLASRKKSTEPNDRDVPMRYPVTDPPVILNVAQYAYRN